jgi:hypothetical protein
MTLYELTGEYLELLEMAESGEYDEQTLTDTLESLDGDIESKADNYAKIMKELEGRIDAYKKEIARMTERKRAIENNIIQLKNHLQSMMLVTGKIKFKTELFSFGIQKNPPSVIIDGEVPEEFLIRQEPLVNKKAIKELLKEKELDFAHLEQCESLRIK